jgi:curved DNA-binding protein CbpA
MDYLHEAYDMLGLSDDEPLTLEGLKGAYKRRAVSCHPDKGGDPAEFDALTKAYLYLQEVYKKLIPRSVRPDSEAEKVTMESAVKYRNDPSLPVFDEGSGISMVVRDADKPLPKKSNGSGVSAYNPPPEPLHINPKKLDMNVFNQLFEQNRLPDPEKDDGYGDWLKSQEGPSKKITAGGSGSMRGKFNLNVFNEAFETEARDAGSDKAANKITRYDSPDALMLTPGAVVLGAEKPAEYTAPAGSRVQYTDLKAAYSTHTTFSQEVGGVKVGKKSYEQAKAERERDPGPTTAEEAARISEMTKMAAQAEAARQMRAAAYDTNAAAYHDRIKQRLLITEKPLQ